MTDRPMNDRPMPMTDTDLEAALRDLARALAPTPAPQLAAAVRSRVEGLGVPAPSLRRRLDSLIPRRGRPLRRGLVLALAALLVLAGLAAAIGFGLPGLRIVILGPGAAATPTANPTAAPPSSPGTGPTATPTSQPIESLGLGDRVDPGAADAAAGRHVLLPTLSELGRPLGVFIRGTSPSTLVSAAYAATSAIPAGSQAPIAGGTPVAILVMELPGASDARYLQKMLPPGTTIEPVAVAGHPGLWIAGEPHELLYVAPDGSVENEPARLAGNVLAWNDGALTFRIEGAPDLPTAMRIAASMR
jgi:hypothetical protein